MSENPTINVASRWDIAEHLVNALRLVPFAPDEAATPGFGAPSPLYSALRRACTEALFALGVPLEEMDEVIAMTVEGGRDLVETLASRVIRPADSISRSRS